MASLRIYLQIAAAISGMALLDLLLTMTSISSRYRDRSLVNTQMNNEEFSFMVTVQNDGQTKKLGIDARELSILSSEGYTIPRCPCIRFGFSVDSIQKAQQEMIRNRGKFSLEFVQKYNFTGQSTCSDFSTQRGGGQRVISYSFYSPERIVKPDSEHFKKYLGQLYGTARSIKDKYEGWTMRIYHNMSEDDEHGFNFLCRMYCNYQHVDICQVQNLPVIGNLQNVNKIGRLWRFAVMGDPTVSKFLIRDSDSWILDREVPAVNEWLSSNKSFHTIHDHPVHKAIMLAGLWGGTNNNQTLMKSIRDEMFHRPFKFNKGYDQYLLATLVWPQIKNDVMQHISYNCQYKYLSHSLPFPTKRKDGLFCGWGTFKTGARQLLLKMMCPLKCRPEKRKDWIYC